MGVGVNEKDNTAGILQANADNRLRGKRNRRFRFWTRKRGSTYVRCTRTTRLRKRRRDLQEDDEMVQLKMKILQLKELIRQAAGEEPDWCDEWSLVMDTSKITLAQEGWREIVDERIKQKELL